MENSTYRQEATLKAGTGNRLLKEVLVVGLGYLVYSQVRGLAGDRVVDAFNNASHVVRLEQSLGIFEELAVQAWILQHEAVVHFFNFVYFYGLFPMILPTAAWLFWKRPHIYELARNAFLASGAIAVFFFLILPTAPPRLMDLGFIDTLGQGLTPTYNSIPGVNHYAAVPSMHVGWNFLAAFSLYLAFVGWPWRMLLLAFPAVMFFSTVVTGNHYFVDGILGIIVALAGLRIALWLQNNKQQTGDATRTSSSL